MAKAKAGTKPDINPKPGPGPEFPIVIKLDDPFEWGSDTITELLIRRKPRGGDLWDMPIDNINIGNAMQIISRVSGMVPPCLELLSLNDTLKAVEAITPFLESGS